MQHVGRNAVHPEGLRPGKLVRTQSKPGLFLLPSAHPLLLSHCRPAFPGSLVTWQHGCPKAHVFPSQPLLIALPFILGSVLVCKMKSMLYLIPYAQVFTRVQGKEAFMKSLSEKLANRAVCVPTVNRVARNPVEPKPKLTKGEGGVYGLT